MSPARVGPAGPCRHDRLVIGDDEREAGGATNQRRAPALGQQFKSGAVREHPSCATVAGRQLDIGKAVRQVKSRASDGALLAAPAGMAGDEER